MKGRLQRVKLKHTKAFWIDVNFKKWKAKDIDNDYLKNIVFFIAAGKGWEPFIHNKKRINKIFQEAYERKIINFAGLLNLHQWALCYHGFSTAWPKYRFTKDGKFEDTE